MKKMVTIWTQEGCSLCEKVKEIFKGKDFEERNAEDLINGDDRNVDAMTQLAMQNMELPLVMIDGHFVNVFDLLNDEMAA
ncbi:MAG: glutaredoxin family protein [Planctomycetota bacterium]